MRILSRPPRLRLFRVGERVLLAMIDPGRGCEPGTQAALWQINPECANCARLPRSRYWSCGGPRSESFLAGSCSVRQLWIVSEPAGPGRYLTLPEAGMLRMDYVELRQKHVFYRPKPVFSPMASANLRCYPQAEALRPRTGYVERRRTRMCAISSPRRTRLLTASIKRPYGK